MAGEAAAVQRPGRLLAEARAARNLAVAEVAQQLKLSASQVEALEADAYEQLPGPVFVRGFVRNYARFLELDVEALVAAVDLPRAPLHATSAVPLSRDIPFPEQRSRKWVPYALILATAVGALVLFEFFFSSQDGVVVSTVPPSPVPVVIQAEPPLPVRVPAPDAVAPATTVPQPEAVTPAEPGSAAPQPVAPVDKTSAGTASLHFVFEAPSWIEVRDRDDRILYSQLNPAGTEQRLQGRPPLNLVVGNAQGVRLNFNGQPFDLAPHTRVEVARFTLE